MLVNIKSKKINHLINKIFKKLKQTNRKKLRLPEAKYFA